MFWYEKLAEIVKNRIEYAEKLWKSTRFIRAILSLLLPSVAIGLVLGLLVKGLIALILLLRRYATQITFGFLLLWGFAVWLDKHRSEKLERKHQEREEREREGYMAQRVYAETKDATYQEQARVLFSVARELGGCGIIPPMRLSNLFSPCRTISKMSGKVILCQYLLQKDRETVDIELIKQTIQTKIDQRLQAGEFPGVPERHIYRGCAYSGFVVHLVKDGEGFLEVYTALVNDDYCRFKASCDLFSDMLPPSMDRRDVDY